MSSRYRFPVVILAAVSLMTILFAACSDKDKTNDEPSQPQDRLVGKWECALDAYGDPWDAPIIMVFDPDGTGYQWFSDEPFSYRWTFSYVASTSKVKIQTQYGVYDLVYEISSNNNTLILYGWDDDDMEELWFTRKS